MGNPCALLVGIKIGTATVKNHMEVLGKLKIEVPYNPAMPFLGIYLKEKKNTNSK